MANILVIDSGTGTGQAAIELCKKFKSVYGIDTLPEQINNATPRDNITYQVGPGEDLSQFQDHSVDMITVALPFTGLIMTGFSKKQSVS